MLHRVIIVGAALALAAPVWSQPVSPTPQDDPAKPQVVMFELGLKNAVELGGQKLAERVSAMYPGLYLSSDGSPVVHGVVVRQLGLYMFTVRVPDILETSLQMLSMMRGGMRPPLPMPARSVGTQPVAVEGRTNATGGGVAPDEMRVSPVVGSPDFEPDGEYRAQVKAALTSAMLDNSRALPLDADDTLMVVATGADSGAASPLYRPVSKQLILTIKSSDLSAYREGRITREEALRRISETHF
jgi:hypothetical protein